MNNLKWGAFFSGFVVSIFFTTLVFGLIINSVWRQEIVDHGCGYYHPETAAFIWKNEYDSKK